MYSICQETLTSPVFLTVTGNVPGLERAYEALGITLATNGEPRLQPYPGKKSLPTLWFLKVLYVMQS